VFHDCPCRETASYRHCCKAHLHHSYDCSSRFVKLSLHPENDPQTIARREIPLGAPRYFFNASGSLANTPLPADLIQDLYVRELKAYKVPAVKATDAEGNVQKWSAPKAPKSPEEADIANELKSYEASAVEIEGQAEGGAPASQEFDWFEEEPEEEEEAKH
jgi:F-type H+-transporting ATPase subunit h